MPQISEFYTQYKNVAHFSTIFLQYRKRCKVKERHTLQTAAHFKVPQISKCRDCAVSFLLLSNFSFCFPAFVQVFLNIWSPSFFPTFSHSCAGLPCYIIQYNPCRTTTLANDHPSYTTIFRVTDSVFWLCGPWSMTIPQTRPTTGSDGIFSLACDHFK